MLRLLSEKHPTDGDREVDDSFYSYKIKMAGRGMSSHQLEG